jgi:hypothetical protein
MIPSLSQSSFDFCYPVDVSRFLLYLRQYIYLSSTVITIVSISTLYVLYLVIYRLFFSPIAGFPGPTSAALTGWYEFYYDVVKKGKYLFEIEKMHDKYGMYHGLLDTSIFLFLIQAQLNMVQTNEADIHQTT